MLEEMWKGALLFLKVMLGCILMLAVMVATGGTTIWLVFLVMDLDTMGARLVAGFLGITVAFMTCGAFAGAMDYLERKR